MKKITIEISDEAHLELLKIQLEERVKNNNKLTIASTAALVIEKALVKEKAAK